MTAIVWARTRAVPRLAELAGRALRTAAVAGARVGRGVPGVVGPLLVAYGAWLAWRPLGFVVAGAVLWLLDRRVP